MARTTAVAKTKGASLPATLTQDMAADVEILRGRLAATTGDKIKVDNKIFTMPSGDTADMVTGIIVDFVYVNAYYPGAFDPNNIVPPDCLSISANPNDGVPSPNGADIQHADCKGCWANAFGSAGKGKACRNSVLIALLPPDATEETPLMTINVSSTALKPFGAYVSAVARAFQRPPYGVLTDFTCDPNFKYDTLRFGNPQALDEGMIQLVRSRREEARERLMTEPDLTPPAANDTKAVRAPAGKGKALQAPRKRG